MLKCFDISWRIEIVTYGSNGAGKSSSPLPVNN